MAYWIGKRGRDPDDPNKRDKIPPDKPDKPTDKPDNCEQKCQALYDSLIEKGFTPEQAKQRQQNCLNRCRGEEPDIPPDEPDEPTGDCPKGDYYTSNNGCIDGYIWFPGKHRCECIEWCKKIGTGASCREFGDGDGGGDDMGAFEFPPGLKEYYDMMMARGKELLGMPVGYTDEMINKMYGKDFEAIRGSEAAQREAASRMLSREGALGTGQATQAFTNIGAGTEQNIANALRDIFIESEKQKKMDILNYTDMANQLFSGGQNYWMLQEAANAARRGDYFRSLELLLQYYGIGVAGYGG